MVDSSTLHRGAKYFMDSGRAATHEEAMALLQSFGLTIHVGPAIAASREEQVTDIAACGAGVPPRSWSLEPIKAAAVMFSVQKI